MAAKARTWAAFSRVTGWNRVVFLPSTTPNISPQQRGQHVLQEGGRLTPRGSCLLPGLGGRAGRGKALRFVPDSVHFSQTLSVLARVDLWTCGVYVWGEGIVLCLHPTSLATVNRCLDPQWLVQSPGLSLSCAWLQLLLSHGHGDGVSDDPRLPPV